MLDTLIARTLKDIKKIHKELLELFKITEISNDRS